MLWSLKRRTTRALSDICGKGVSGPLIPDDSRCLGFFYRIVEHLKAGAEKAVVLAEEKSRDLFDQAASDVFRLDSDFDFASVLDPVPETIRALTEWVKIHVEDLVTRHAPEGRGVGSDDDVSL
ncbi:hypothetical protein D1007_14518 [Hordeum vulgare]|nr:hypothetical protein D1007_14518 [Hordeum vulgare]